MTTITTRMQEIVLEINASLEVLQTESVKVGTLLNEANEEMKAEGKKAADFLKWTADNFGIGKAQAYKLMKVATFFKEDNRFKGVAMRVLYQLATEASELELEKAAEFAQTGSLTTAVVNQLLNPEPVVTKPEGNVKPESKEEADEKQAEIAQALANVSDRHEFDMGDSPANQAAAVVQQANDEGLQAEIVELRKALQAANDLIKSMQAEKVQHNTSKEMPLLPQFKKDCPATVLGLTLEEASKKTAISKAFREMIKLGYGKGHEAFEILTTAKDKLLADIK